MKSQLTERELQVVECIALGFTDKEIAEILFLSPDTIRTHRKKLKSKIGCRNAADITRYYYEIPVEEENIEQIRTRLNTRLVMFIAWVFLLLSIAIEFQHTNAIRVRPAKAQTSRIAKRASRSRNKDCQFKLSA